MTGQGRFSCHLTMEARGIQRRKQSKFIAEKGGETRKAIYLPLLQKKDCPIIVSEPTDTFIEGIFYEPFYQLTRQTLLAHEMVKGKDFREQPTIFIGSHLTDK